MDGSSDDAAAISLYETFFDLEDNLCQRYPALTPFVVRREKIGEVILLVKRINRKNQREKGIQHTDKVWTDSKGNVHIRRKAKADNWY